MWDRLAKMPRLGRPSVVMSNHLHIQLGMILIRSGTYMGEVEEVLRSLSNR